MKLPVNLSILENVKLVSACGDRVLLNISGTAAWCGCYDYGVCLAIDTGLSDVNYAWLKRIALWLASIRSAMNDSLFMEHGKLYFLRSYDPALNNVQWEMVINKQLELVNWFAHHEKI